MLYEISTNTNFETCPEHVIFLGISFEKLFLYLHFFLFFYFFFFLQLKIFHYFSYKIHIHEVQLKKYH